MAAEYTVGPTGTYDTIAEALAAIPADLSGEGLQDIIVEAGDYSGFTISGFTNPSSSDYIQVRAKAGAEHKGSWSSGVRISSSSTIALDYTRLSDLVFSAVSCNYSSDYSYIRFERCLSKANNTYAFYFRSCSRITLINCVGWTYGTASYARTLNTEADVHNLYIYNCVFYNNVSSSTVTMAMYCWGNNYIIRNTIAYSVNDSGFQGVGSGYTVTKLVTTDGSGSSDYYLSLLNIGFKDIANGDFHLDPRWSLLPARGDDLSAYFTTDIDGETIPTGFWPIGVDYLPNHYFVNLGSNTDASGQSASGNQGTYDSPFNARDLLDKCRTVGGTGSADNIYRMKGSAFFDDFASNEQLSIYNTFASWGHQWKLDQQTTDATVPARSWYDGIMKYGTGTILDPNASTHYMYDVVLETSDTDLSHKRGTVQMRGCTVNESIDIIDTSAVLDARDSIFYELFGSTATGDTITLVNCVAREANEAALPFTTKSTTGCQYAWTPAGTKHGYSDIDPELFIVDTAVTINAVGPFTDYPFCLWGNPRRKYNEAMVGAGIGATYQHNILTVAASGYEYTTLALAEVSLNRDLASYRGVTEIVFKKGTYEGYTIPNTFIASVSQYIILRPITGYEHLGYFDSADGVIFSSSLAVNVRYSRIRDIQINGNMFLTYTGSGEDSFVDRVILKGGQFSKQGEESTCVYTCCISWNSPSHSWYCGKAINCISWNSTYKNFRYVAMYNCIFGGTGTGIEGGSGDYNVGYGSNGLFNQTQASLRFVDPDNGDFHVASNSILLKSGTSSQSAYLSKDINGDTIVDWMIGVDWNAGAGFTDTIIEIGPGKPWTTLRHGLNAVPRDLTGGGVREYRISAGTWSGTNNETNYAPDGNRITTPSDYMLIRAAVGSDHKGIFDSGVIIGYPTAQLPYTRVRDIQFNDTDSWHGIPEQYLENCLFKLDSVSVISLGAAAVKFYKCVFWDYTGSNTLTCIQGGSNGYYVDVINCVIKGFNKGCDGKAGYNLVRAINTVCAGQISSSFSDMRSLSDYNCSSDGTAPGIHSAKNMLQSRMKFKDVTNGDFRVNPSSYLLTKGTSQSSLFTKDIKDDTIVKWMVGAAYSNNDTNRAGIPANIRTLT